MIDSLAALVTVALAAAAVRHAGLADARARLTARRGAPPAWFVRWWADVGGASADAAWPRATGAAALVLGVVALSPGLALPVGGAAVAGALALPRLARARQQRRRRSQLAPALDTVAASLRAGRSLTDALGDAGTVGAPLGPELEGLARAARHGRPLTDAVAEWVGRHDDGETATVAAALVVGATAGGPVARAIDGTAQSLRERQAITAEAHALAAQARMSALVLSVAPVLVTGLLAAGDGEVRHFFTATLLGRVCLVAGIGLDIAGAWWMQRMLRAAVDPGVAR